MSEGMLAAMLLFTQTAARLLQQIVSHLSLETPSCLKACSQCCPAHSEPQVPQLKLAFENQTGPLLPPLLLLWLQCAACLAQGFLAVLTAACATRSIIICFRSSMLSAGLYSSSDSCVCNTVNCHLFQKQHACLAQGFLAVLTAACNTINYYLFHK